ncbi:hypothetical protein CYMTET_45044 [Cymbomonas tetramitiformis]|uniref:Uncharacterized protein n=2 Tax=Cymbomonas tetramitiformis TaxID=36881 RepID=A0AAE0BYM9_9CHLO|nr:hypothetical protein CYMTET_49680 [Cymbomonas tetramitiformis]KAK3244529.1 hypothetical protein CYMTET_45859 [Cymbomonas tetramitiformis]KAK3245384.1 hypothetical protein CYMTET_45044 [Cymbomonas tetramitiformis]
MDKTDFEKSFLMIYNITTEVLKWRYVTRVTTANGRCLHPRIGRQARGERHFFTLVTPNDERYEQCAVWSLDTLKDLRTSVLRTRPGGCPPGLRQLGQLWYAVCRFTIGSQLIDIDDEDNMNALEVMDRGGEAMILELGWQPRYQSNI